MNKPRRYKESGRVPQLDPFNGRAIPQSNRAWMLDILPKDAVCAEIGVFEGSFSATILKWSRPKRLHLIDPWRYENSALYQKSCYGRPEESQAMMDSRYDSVVSRFLEHTANGTVAIHRTGSGEASRLFPDEYFDWVYIDGNHQFEWVQSDLEAFAPKLKRAGVIAGDDYGIEGWWNNGVTLAVNMFRDRYGWKLNILKESQYILSR